MPGEQVPQIPDDFHDRLHCIQRPGVTKQEVVDGWTKWAETYDNDFFATENLPPVIGAPYMDDFFTKRGISKAIRILDGGAGTGILGAELAELGFTNLDALDPSAGMLEKAKEKDIYKHFICDFLGTNRLDVPDATYDAVVSAGAFIVGHIGPECFGELIRIVKPGGHVMIVVKEIPPEISKSPYIANLRAEMNRRQENGQWKILTMTEISKWMNYPVMFYVCEICPESQQADGLV